MGYPVNPRLKPSPRQRGQNERAEALTGSRSDAAPEKKAVTFEAAAEMGQLKLLSSRATAAPTMEQHNALVEDIHALAAVLNRMGAKITGF